MKSKHTNTPTRTNSISKPRSKSSYKKKADKIYLEGKIVESLPGVRFVVKIERSNGLEPLMLNCMTLSMIKVKKIKIIKGDSVEVEIDPLDLTKGLIVTRL